MNEPVLVIMAAGIGSRFGGPKQITSLDDEGHKIIDFSLFDSFKAGFRKVVFIIEHSIEQDFREAIGYRIEKIFDTRYVFQELDMLPEGLDVPLGRVKPWGTGHAIACARDAIDGPFAVINADDYYGFNAIDAIYRFLRQERKPSEHAMVGYLLKNTVTDSGYVSRGICETEDGYLKEVVERVHIEKRGEDAAFTEDGIKYYPLDGSSTVSMNLWGFQKEILTEFTRRFPLFLQENLAKAPLKCEYYLPSVVDKVIKEGLGTVRVLNTDDKWYGVTYAQDLETIEAAMASKKKAGLYPARLWLEPEAAYKFKTEGIPVSVSRFGHGHINGTFLVGTSSQKRYLLQRISEAFDIESLMENIESVTAFAKRQSTDAKGSLSLIRTLDDKSFYKDDSGAWRMYDFIERSVSIDRARTPEDFYECGIAFGHFLRMMADFPAENLHETIKNFHDTPDRYRIFKETLSKDPCQRKALVEPEIAFALKREAEAGSLQEMREKGLLPLRVTHNDTKLNNCLFDQDTGKPLCVVDLDTVMPGLSAYDYGDAIRYGAATASEDERDLSRMTIDLILYRAFTRGYLESCPMLTDREIDVFTLGAWTMTLECGLRFLTDFLDGDHYFSTRRPGQNLDRARAQFKLLTEMEKHRDEMEQIVREERRKIMKSWRSLDEDI